VNGGDSSSPAVVSGVVYVSYACQQTYAFDAANGDLLWHYDNGCAGGGGSTPAVHGNSVYVRDVDTGNVILDKATGQLTGTFNAQPMPAFDSTHAYLVNGGALSARNLSIGTTAWSDDLGATSAPIVAGDWVYEGTSTGLVAVRAGSGATVWSASIPGGVPPPHEGGAGPPTTGLAAAAGYLIVPTATSIIAYHQRDFAVQAASPLRLPRGATAHSAVTIKSLFGFAGNVTLAVTGTSGGATASVAPRTVSVAPRQNGTARVIITAGRLATRFTLTVRACGPHFCRSSALKVQVG
jgi:outer membrane protein assembly factor BamB